MVCYVRYKTGADGSGPKNYTTPEDIIHAEYNALSQVVSFTLYSVLCNIVSPWGNRWQMSLPAKCTWSNICHEKQVVYSSWNTERVNTYITPTYTRHSFNPMGNITLLFHFTHEETKMETDYIPLPMVIKLISGRAKIWNKIVCLQNLGSSVY